MMEYRWTSPVNAFTEGRKDGRSPYGVIDMAGNVAEWTSDGRQPDARGLRGGGWNDQGALKAIVSFQVDAVLEFENEATGFRCAADISYDVHPIDNETAPGGLFSSARLVTNV